ncbi:hypothetical protein Rifp1Sym_bm00140 [endosymbiont of Riftia pachyptila (vent Ph05)]|uniref:Uncharacterized protein n=2 Tax=endosymbiont of Riftia pachyptila TaxID=54396 RepID=G2DDF2_9GAMM|nr:hypothetical protein Rifp1Sym_bm00140 [endosymbiont of Riftia pachyptila (vent Ph05)]
MFSLFNNRADLMDQTLFSVPAPDSTQSPLVETHPGQLRQWVASLPYASPERVAEFVIANLSLLNRHPDRVKDRAELMEIYRMPSTRLCRIPIGKRGAPDILQIRRLLTEMAYGYKHIINECLNNRSWLKQRKRLLHSIFYALKFLALEQFVAFEGYDCRSRKSLSEVLKLYALAEQQNLHNEIIDDHDQAGDETSTISHQTKRIILVSLLDPCHLEPGEARICFDFLNQYAGKAKFGSVTATGDAAGRFVIDMSGMEPSRPFDPDTSPNLDPRRYRRFSLTSVSKRIHRAQQKIAMNGEEPPPGLQHLPPEEAILILRRILKSWHIQQQRGADRQNRPRRVAIALGVTSIHHYLQTLAIQNESSSDSSFSVILNGNLGADYAPQHKSFECMQVDQSASGVALQLQLSQSSSPQVGQLLLITASEDENSSDWRIGVVRRAMRKGNSSLELGVQFIRGHVSPITLRTPNKGKEEQPGRRALFIDRGHKHRGSVIVSRNSLELDQGYRVDEQTPDPVIVPMQLAEATPGFARYRLKDT